MFYHSPAAPAKRGDHSSPGSRRLFGTGHDCLVHGVYRLTRPAER